VLNILKNLILQSAFLCLFLLFEIYIINKDTMKLIKSIIPLAAGLFVLASCDKTETEVFSYNPTHVIATDGNGVNLYKREYTYYDSNDTYSQKFYKWKASDWELTNEYGFKYSYWEGNLPMKCSVTDNGKPLYREEYEYDSNGLCIYQKRTDYSGSEETTTENRFTYETENYRIKVRYVSVPDTAGTWKQYAKEEYGYDSDGNNTKIVVSLVVDEKLVESAESDFTFSDGTLSSSVEWKIIDKVKKKYRTVDYVYDRHKRCSSKTTEVFNLDVDPVTSTKTIEHIYYKD